MKKRTIKQMNRMKYFFSVLSLGSNALFKIKKSINKHSVIENGICEIYGKFEVIM